VSRRSGSKTSSLLKARLLVFVLALTMNTTATSGESAEPRDVQLVVTDSGQYILSGMPVALADLRAKLRELKSSGRPINLHVTGSSTVEYKFVMPAIQIAQEEGLSKVGLLTIPPAAPAEPGSSASSSPK
jgi:biopolymer transport protein ExbD